MSLMERVSRAGKANLFELGEGRRNKLEDLKAALQQYISSDEIAAIMADNPYRAKNEIRSVCAHIFEEDAWGALSSNERDALVKELIDTVFGLGPLETLLRDESVTEIMVNGTQSLFFEREGKLFQSENPFSDQEQVRALIDRIIGPLGRRIDEASPMVNARLKQGHRVNAIISPLSLDGPILTIRKFREHLYTLEEMVALNSMDETVRKFLVWAVFSRKNMAVSGGTGSGKTTLLNALSCEIPAGERIITIEDSAELKFSEHPHVVRLEARPRNAEGIGEIGIRDLVINALRMRPDRIIVGECRGGEALDMLQAMNTGHDGSLTTLHANSPNDAVMRLSTMVRYIADLPIDAIESQIASAIDILVQITRNVEGLRYVNEIASFEFSKESSSCRVSTLFRKDHGRKKGCWLAFPPWIDELIEEGLASKEEIAVWKHDTCLSA